MSKNPLNLSTLSVLFSDENKAREFFESILWPNGAICPHCKCKEAYKLTGKPESKHPVKPGVYKCKKCRKKFTVKIGTIFEESKLSFCKWLMALHLMSSSKKGVSSCQIARELGVTMQTAWFLTHRIREAMKEGPLAEMLSGTVEADETYVGGKPRYKKISKRGRGTDKTPVMVLVERDGKARTKVLERVTSEQLKNEIAVNVARDAIVMTDEFPAYRGLDHDHETVNHGQKQYAKKTKNGIAHTNTAESFFALLKRGHYGTFHQLSRKHLPRYCDEFSFRWNHRKINDSDRMIKAIEGSEGKRLMYKASKNSLVQKENLD